MKQLIKRPPKEIESTSLATPPDVWSSFGICSISVRRTALIHTMTKINQKGQSFSVGSNPHTECLQSISACSDGLYMKCKAYNLGLQA